MITKYYLSAMISVVLFLGAPLAAYACSVCLTGANDPTADAFNASVLFLMATPYAVVGSIGSGLYYAYRRKLAKQSTEQNDQALAQPGLDQEEV